MLAVAGAARPPADFHLRPDPVGVLMGVAANFIARYIERYRGRICRPGVIVWVAADDWKAGTTSRR